MEDLLRLDSVSAGYGRTEVLHGVTLSVRQGEIVTLIGANGAGKSTLMAAIMRLLRITSGRIQFAGRQIGKLETSTVVAAGIALVPERRQLFDDMTVEENLLLGGYLQSSVSDITAALEQQYGLFPRLRERRTQRACTLSGGEQQMVAVARAMMSQPRLLLLDEPSLGLAPRLVRQVMELVVRYRAGGGTVLLVEQNARAALAVADRAYVIETGRITLTGSSAELLASQSLLSAYFGEDTEIERRLVEEKSQLRS